MGFNFGDITGFVQQQGQVTGLNGIGDSFSNFLSGLSNIPSTFSNIGNSIASLLGGNSLYILIGVGIVAYVIVSKK